MTTHTNKKVAPAHSLHTKADTTSESNTRMPPFALHFTVRPANAQKGVFRRSVHLGLPQPQNRVYAACGSATARRGTATNGRAGGAMHLRAQNAPQPFDFAAWVSDYIRRNHPRAMGQGSPKANTQTHGAA